MGRIDFGVTHIPLVVEQSFDQFPATGGSEAPIGHKTDQQEFAGGAGQRQAQIAAIGAGRIEVIQRAGDQQVGVGIKVIGKLIALVAQVALDLELHLLRAVAVIGAGAGLRNRAAQFATELGIHHVVAQIGDVANHAGDAQAALGYHAVAVKVAAVEVGVGDDGTARHFIKGNVFRREVGRAGHHDCAEQTVRIQQSPGGGLHATQAATHHRRQRLNTQSIQQQRLGMHPVFHRDHGKVRAIDMAVRTVGVEVHGAGGAKARSQVVHTDDKKPVGVHRLARTDHAVPPAFGLGLPRVNARHMVRGVERVADQHRIALVGVERAIGLKRQVVLADGRTALQRKRRIKMHRLGRGNKHKKQNPAKLNAVPGQKGCSVVRV